MNQRFVIFTFTACTVMFAGIWAVTAPTPQSVQSVVTPAVDAAAAVTYADCDAVRAANAAPLRADQPGYRAALDANMNGVACEPTGGTVAPPPPGAPVIDPSMAIESPPLPDLPAAPQIDLPPPDPQAGRLLSLQ